MRLVPVVSRLLGRGKGSLPLRGEVIFSKALKMSEKQDYFMKT